MSRPRPDSVFDEGLQHERTALSWERTAVASMVAGVLMARYAAQSIHFGVAMFGVAMVVFGAGMLVWAGSHYDELHGPLREGHSPAHPRAARLVGQATVIFTASTLLLALVIAGERLLSR